jgi:DNA polymerase-4
MDMFYVAVELRQRPELRGKPVVVGGDGKRGVVAAASYEARRYGVFSAMPSVRARRLCPQAIFLPGDMDLYVQVSSQVFDIFRDFTPLVEGLSLDEAFLDVTGAQRLLGDGVAIAEAIRKRVLDEVGLVCSVGIATSKFVAKLASKTAKPIADHQSVRPGRGVVQIESGKEQEFIHGLNVEALWGVGPATLAKLQSVSIKTVAELAVVDLQILKHLLGDAHATQLQQLANGIDHREVEPNTDSKSIGHEETFSNDIFDIETVRRHLVRMSDLVARRCRDEELAPRTCTVKIKYSDFVSITRSNTSPTPITSAQAIMQMLDGLLIDIEVARGVRLVGISTRNFAISEAQLSLFDEGTHSQDATSLDEVWAPATAAIDDIRERFGDDSIGLASTLHSKRRPGSSKWGPEE